MLKKHFHLLQEAGTDEAGRGCLAGPVTAAAVILPENFNNHVLNDSKMLTEKQREILRPILENEAICYGVAHVFPKKIDEINILNASILAMHKALDHLSQKPEFIIVDGNRFKPYKDIPSECIIKGDVQSLSVSDAYKLDHPFLDAYL